MRLATYNVENLFARARALDPADPAKGQPALSAYEEFNRIAAHPVYSDEDKAAMLAALETLRVSGHRTRGGRRANPDLFGDAFAVLRENRGDFLAAPADAEPGSSPPAGRPGTAGSTSSSTPSTRSPPG